MVLAILLATTHFAGGTTDNLAATLATASGEGVVIAQAIRHNLPELDFDIARRTELGRQLQKEAGFRIAPGIDLTLHDNLVSVSRLPLEFREDPAGKIDTAEPATGNNAPTADAIKDGKVTLATENGKLLNVDAIAKMPLTKKVTPHWFFSNLALSINVKDLPERDFLSLVAKAVGGLLIPSKDGYRIDLNVEDARRRISATLQQRHDSPPLPKNAMIDLPKLEFLMGVVKQLTTKQLADVLAQDNNETRIALQSGMALTTLAEQRTRDYEDAQQNKYQVVNSTTTAGTSSTSTGTTRTRNRGSRISNILNHVDPGRTTFIVITSRLDVTIEIPLVDNNGRPLPVIKIS